MMKNQPGSLIKNQHLKQNINIMKKQSNTLFTKIGKDAFADLTTEIKETISFGYVEPHAKVFTTSDLWNIYRQAKNRPVRRYL